MLDVFLNYNIRQINDDQCQLNNKYDFKFMPPLQHFYYILLSLFYILFMNYPQIYNTETIYHIPHYVISDFIYQFTLALTKQICKYVPFKEFIITYMKTLFKNEITQFPKITLTQLISKSLMNNKGKSLRNSSNIKDSISNRNANNGLLSVQEPFYVDRYKMHVHAECHEQGKCLACQYDKLKPFQMGNKKLFPLTSRQRKQIFRSQRVSEAGLASTKSLKKQPQYEQNMNGLTTYIKNQMKKISRKAKHKFAESTKRRCSQNEIIALCIQFLLNPDKKLDKQNCDQESRNKLKQILNSITRYSIQKLITDPGFIKYVGQYNITSEQVSNTIRKKNKVRKQCSIREIVLQDNEAVVIHSGQRKTQDKRKGVIFSDLESLANELHSSTQSLCTAYFIEQNIELTDEVKKKLEQIAYKNNAQFKAALSAIYDFLEKMNQSGCASENVRQKLQMAVEFITEKIPKKDKDKKKKQAELDNLLSEYRNLMENSKKKEIQKQRSNKMLAANSRFYNTKDNKHDSQTSKIVVKTRPRRKEQKKKKSQEQHEMEAHINQKSDSFENQKNQKSKLQDGVGQDHNGTRSQHQSQDQQYYQISDRNLFKSSFKISDNKSDSRRTSLNHISLKFKHPQTQIEKRPSMRQNSKISHKPKDRLTPDSESRQQNMGKITQSSETQQKTQEQLKDQEQQNTMETSQKKKKALLRIKAAELLKQNQQLIKFTEKVLRNMNLNKYVINQNDCLLVQKKKVRHLRELIRLRMQNGEVPEDLVNQILQYLSVFEDNYFFLLQKTPDSYGEQFSHGLQFNFRQVINKKQVYNDFNFYKMNDDYIFGQAEEEEMNFSFKNAKFDKSWQIMSVKNLQRKLKDRQILVAKSIEIARPSFNDLIQTDLPCISNTKAYGIGRILEEQLLRKDKQRMLQSTKSQERVLLTENQ